MPSRQRTARSSLTYSLDKDVYQFTRKIIDGNEPPQRLTVDWILEQIHSSNSSLKRTKKRALELSIETVLDVMKADAEEDDSAASLDGIHEGMMGTNQDSDIMNRKLANAILPSQNNEPLSKTSKQRDRQPNGEPNAKRRKGTVTAPDRSPPSDVSLTDVGGADHVIRQLNKLMFQPLFKPQRYISRRIQPPRGILLSGPPGCGKTMIANAFAAEYGLPFISISAPSIVSGMSGESEKLLREYFEEAKKLAPCLFFIDEIDSITPKRDMAQREMEKRIVAQLLTCMDELALGKTGGKAVIVLAATNRPDSLDPALRRAGRFDKEINFTVPSESVREQILRTLTREMHTDGIDFTKLAKKTPGFVGADLNDLVSTAGAAACDRDMEKDEARAAELSQMEMDESPVQQSAVAAVRRLVKWANSSPSIELLEISPITNDDFLTALTEVQPSSKREGFATIPDTTWSDIGALEHVKRELQATIVKPIDNPQRYEHFGVTPVSGVLLSGPPGCGKTLLAKAVANESKANFISVKGPELLNKYVGESERAVRQVFARARSSIPCIIFFDEFEALVPKRDDSKSEATARVVNTMLAELDGIESRTSIYVIAATNRPDMIDPAILRPGRIEKRIRIDLPGKEERHEILKTLTRRQNLKFKVSGIADRCEKFSGADLGSLVRNAAMAAIDRESNEIDSVDFDTALAQVAPSVHET